MAQVNLPGMQTKEFCMWQVRRYQASSLVQCLREFGWENVGQIPFMGSKVRPPQGVLIFQKQLSKMRH